MRIKNVSIRNFRSIRNVNLDVEPLTALIGENNAGKSTIMKALELFFEPAPKFSNADLPHGSDADESEISVEFVDFTPVEVAEFGTAIIDGKMTVARKLSEVGADAGQYFVTARVCPAFDEIRDEENGTQKRAKYNALARETEGLETVTSVNEVDAKLARWEAENPNECEARRQRGFFGAPNVASGKLRKKTSLHLIPAVRDASEHAADSKRSPIISLLSEISRQTLENKQALAEFIEKTKEEYAELSNPENVPELAGISELLTENLRKFYPDSGLRTQWDQGEGIEISYPTPRILVENRGVITDIARVGHGLQRAALFSIVRYLAERTSDDEAPDGLEEFPEAASDIIILVEEPEIYQHPSKQLVIFEAFKEIVESHNSNTGIRVQIIYTTHSEKFIQMNDFEIARIIKRDDTGDETLTTALGLSIEECSAAIASMLEPPQQPMSAEAFVSKLHIFTREVCEGFFADRVVLVEGPTDKAILEASYRIRGRNVHQESICIISAEGKSKMDKPFFIFSKLGIKAYLVFDNDSQKEEGKQKTAINRLLQKVCGVAEPVDMPEGVESKFAALADDLEAYFKAQLGEKFDAFYDVIAEEYGLSYSEIKKTPAATLRVFEMAQAEGISFDLFDDIIAAIDAL